jgi:UDP-N-acetyl-D-galactosamine dehydrogenase
VTEEIAVPILEKMSGLKCGVDFTVGYSPERINPGDKEKTFTKILKVVSGQDEKTADIVAQVYGSVVEAGVYRASSIRVAEAAKVIENTQRDLNIALINELAIIFEKMNLDTQEVLAAAGTKWNFLKFTPGLVGGHCIGVDPYYLTHKAERLGYIPQVILSGRRINDGMGKFIAQKAIKEMILANNSVLGAKVLVLGLTFKENCPDIRNSKVPDIVNELKEFGAEVHSYEPLASAEEVVHEYGITPSTWDDILKNKYQLVIAAVAHDEFKQLKPSFFASITQPSSVFVDVKGLYSKGSFEEMGLRYWRL